MKWVVETRCVRWVVAEEGAAAAARIADTGGRVTVDIAMAIATEIAL